MLDENAFTRIIRDHTSYHQAELVIREIKRKTCFLPK